MIAVPFCYLLFLLINKFWHKVTKKFGRNKKKSYLCTHKRKERDVAQLVAHTSGGREVASSSLVIPTFEGAESLMKAFGSFLFFCCFLFLGRSGGSGGFLDFT